MCTRVSSTRADALQAAIREFRVLSAIREMYNLIKVCAATIAAATLIGLLVWGGVWVFADVDCSKTEEVQSRFSCWVADARKITEDEFDDVKRSAGRSSTDRSSTDTAETSTDTAEN